MVNIAIWPCSHITMKQLAKLKYILILLAITFFAVKPLLHPGLPPTHDGENHVIRSYEFDKAIRDGSIYPRWAKDLNNGYGIPLFNYVYPLPNYASAFFHVFGMSFIDTFKMNLLVATFIGVIFFYFWSRLFFTSIASLTAAIFYAFSPYRFVDIYVRGSVGEVWALACFPAFLWSLTKFVESRKMLYFILSSLFLAATILSHNILALMFMLFGITYAAFLIWLSGERKLRIAYCALLIVLALSLSAIFWLPALAETKYAQGLQIYGVDANFPELYQLLIPSWGTGFSGGSLENQMSFQIGVANLLVIFIAVILLMRHVKKKLKNKEILIFSLAWFILVFFLMLSASKSLWHSIPLMNYFQFPWRFLSLMILICSYIAGAVVQIIVGKKKQMVLAVLLITLAVFTTISYTQPAYYHNRTDSYYISRDNFIHGTNSPGDVFNTAWMNKKLHFKNKKIEVVHGKAKIVMFESKTSFTRFSLESDEESTVVANVAYFPGWELFVDGRKANLAMTKDGIMQFSVPQGKHMAELRFGDTMVRRAGAALSILGIVACLGLWGFRKRLL